MKTLKMLQKLLFIVAALAILYGILAVIVPSMKPLILTHAGWQRFANTLALLSIGLGVIVIADKKG